jgi:AcrR family transcriptional regulator
MLSSHHVSKLTHISHCDSYDAEVTDETHIGRPRSEHARVAVLHAVDDLLLEVGYASLTMKGIAERAGVGRQTVYRWWSTKAEVLFEAAITDAADELAFAAETTSVDDIAAYLNAVTVFLTASPAGAAYRALIGEAQHDPAVAQMMESADPFTTAANAVLHRTIARGDVPKSIPPATAVAILTGPAYFRVLAGQPGQFIVSRDLATALLAALRELPANEEFS